MLAAVDEKRKIFPFYLFSVDVEFFGHRSDISDFEFPPKTSKVGRVASVAFDGRRPSCLENLRTAGHKNQ